jgi:anaerobic selenocysteine-containing dehydrogenase
MGFPLARRVEGLKELLPADVVLINPDDAAQAGIEQGDEVLVSASHFERVWPAHLDRGQLPAMLRVMLSDRDCVGPVSAPVEIRKIHVQTD